MTISLDRNQGRAGGARAVLRRALVPAAVAAALTGTVVATVLAPSASASSTAVRSGSPTVPGHPNLLADTTGHAPLSVVNLIGGGVQHVPGGWVLNCGSKGGVWASSQQALVNTRTAFTVSSWVYAKGAARGTETAISQGTGGQAQFELGRAYNPANRAGSAAVWSFKVQGRSSHGTGAYVAYAPLTLKTVNSWALLTGAWDPAHHRILLYVDGKLVAAKAAPNVTFDWGGLQLCRARTGGGSAGGVGAWADGFDGLVGHVQVWNRELTAAQVLQTYKAGGPHGVPATHSWLVQ